MNFYSFVTTNSAFSFVLKVYFYFIDLFSYLFLVLQTGSSSDPCSATYHGPSAESESEVKAIVDYLKQNRPFVGAIDFHSFSQAVVYPYGWGPFL